ncbi:hypothetical protein BLNAU_12080 [Blattamonas nauphoetae]|uniref:Uncharacterized protein n=1 Tax=Blattamonas nauphoetae TaxID=2049346 RepID=A0ABQ9XN02_9EUKA|nr:hypothetical protein BLNAU_12080 [Blattamonas nauphoetae]
MPTKCKNDQHRDNPPLFLEFNPDNIRSVTLGSQPFMSLVAFVKEGNNLDHHAATQARVLLNRFRPRDDGPFTANTFLFDLVPTPDGSCSGFTESIILLITSSNEDLVIATWHLLDSIVTFATPQGRLAFLASGFFSLLPPAFYKQELHISTYTSCLIQIVSHFISNLHYLPRRSIVNERLRTRHSFEEIVMDKFIRPIEPFVDMMCKIRRRFYNSGRFLDWSDFFGKMIEFSPYVEPITQLVVSSSVTLAYTDSLPFVESDRAIDFLLRGLPRLSRVWRTNEPDILNREQQIMAKLREEGISDEIELLFQCRLLDQDEVIHFFRFGNSIRFLGRNAPDWGG